MCNFVSIKKSHVGEWQIVNAIFVHYLVVREVKQGEINSSLSLIYTRDEKDSAGIVFRKKDAF